MFPSKLTELSLSDQFCKSAPPEVSFTLPYFREHGVLLYLDKTLYHAFIKLQADKALGRSFTGLLAFTEGMFKLGYLSKEEHDLYVARYSRPLLQEANIPGEPEKEAPKLKPIAKLQVKRKVEDLSRLFSMALGQWPTMKEKSRESFLKKASEHPEIPNSKLILALANGAVALECEGSPEKTSQGAR